MPADSEKLDPDDAPEVAAEYIKPYRDRWNSILASGDVSPDLAALVGELLDQVEFWRMDHYAMGAQALNVTSWLEKKAGMNPEPWKPEEK